MSFFGENYDFIWRLARALGRATGDGILDRQAKDTNRKKNEQSTKLTGLQIHVLDLRSILVLNVNIAMK